MHSEQPELRYPKTWEANLLVAITAILVLLSAAIATAFGLLGTMAADQTLVILPGLLWIAARRLSFRATLRLHPISWGTVVWSVLGGQCHIHPFPSV